MVDLIGDPTHVKSRQQVAPVNQEINFHRSLCALSSSVVDQDPTPTYGHVDILSNGHVDILSRHV